MSELKVNTKVKDRLFRVIFGGRYGKENTLSLYNALNGTSYTNADDISITTLETVVYIHMKNDVSFLFDSIMSFIEQQSTECGNLPLRSFMYASTVISDYVSKFGRQIYSTKTLRIPSPRCIIFYNGTAKLPAYQKHHLSDAFEKPILTGDYEWSAEVYNLNHPDNTELIKKSKPLYEYCIFIAKIQDNLRAGLSKADAVHKAVDEAIDEGILYDILTKERNEVEMNVLTEFDDEEFAKVMHDDGYEEGYDEGIQKGLSEGIQKGLSEGIQKGLSEGIEKGNLDATNRIIKNMLTNSMTIDVIVAATGCTEDYILNIKNS